MSSYTDLIKQNLPDESSNRWMQICLEPTSRQPKLERHVAVGGYSYPALNITEKKNYSSYEKTILGQLGWYMTVPTPYIFTVRYTKASIPFDNNEMENMVFFYIELRLKDYTVIIRNNPSKLDASAVYAARCTIKKTPAWTKTLKHHTRYSEDQGYIRDCAFDPTRWTAPVKNGDGIPIERFYWTLNVAS
ncbi:G2/mitotic-specific cyclin S13-7-like protein [Tanacetum coccineum]